MWYSKLDGRSQRSLSAAIQENQEAMKAYASLGVPLEVNESHQWSLRDAPDSVAAATFYLAAYNAKKLELATTSLNICSIPRLAYPLKLIWPKCWLSQN